MKVSVLTAVAIKEEGKSTVELRLATNQQYDKIAVFFDGRLLTFPHFDVSWQDFAGKVKYIPLKFKLNAIIEMSFNFLFQT